MVGSPLAHTEGMKTLEERLATRRADRSEIVLRSRQKRAGHGQSESHWHSGWCGNVKPAHSPKVKGNGIPGQKRCEVALADLGQWGGVKVIAFDCDKRPAPATRLYWLLVDNDAEATY